MNTPMPTDREIAEELTSVLLSEAERVTPKPALHEILNRAHEAGPTRSTRRRGGGWLPVIGGVVATAGLVAAAILIFGTGEEQRTSPEPASCAVQVHEGCPVDLAVWFAMETGEVHSAGVTATSSGNLGLDAVQTLLDAPSRSAFPNYWHGYNTIPPDSGPIAQVNDVTHADQQITVDFDRPLNAELADLQASLAPTILQQLVLTVQSALHTDDPVLITVNGEPANEAFGAPLTGPIAADWTIVSGIRPKSPALLQTVTSPVTFTGRSTTSEGNIRWSITQAGEQVRQGFATTGGSLGMYEPYDITVRLAPGDYTVKLWDANTASGAEKWTDELSVVYIDFTVVTASP